MAIITALLCVPLLLAPSGAPTPNLIVGPGWMRLDHVSSPQRANSVGSAGQVQVAALTNTFDDKVTADAAPMLWGESETRSLQVGGFESYSYVYLPTTRHGVAEAGAVLHAQGRVALSGGDAAAAALGFVEYSDWFGRDVIVKLDGSAGQTTPGQLPVTVNLGPVAITPSTSGGQNGIWSDSDSDAAPMFKRQTDLFWWKTRTGAYAMYYVAEGLISSGHADGQANGAASWNVTLSSKEL